MEPNRLTMSQSARANTFGVRRRRGNKVTARPSAIRGQAANGGARHLALLAALVAPFWGAAAGKARAADCADVDLVLAIDGSGSIDYEEFALQKLGYASAFRREDVQDALNAAGTVDVAVVFWADTEMAVQVLPWMRLTDGQSAEVFAERLGGLTRKVHGDTGIGRGLSVALDLLEMPGRCGIRKIVNISGDGTESFSPRARARIPIAEAKARAATMGVIVNALAIENEVADLADWYSERVIVGPGAFVMRVDRFETFAESIARKLIREVGLPNLALDHMGSGFTRTGVQAPGPKGDGNS